MRSLEFQDDIAKPSSSKFECQASQETIAEMITSKQLVFKKEKCQVMIVGTSAAAGETRRRLEMDLIMMEDAPVKQNDRDKYLGDFLHSRQCQPHRGREAALCRRARH